MTSTAVLFYGRRSRSSRSFDDLGFGSSASSPLSSSSSSSTDLNNSSNQRHRRRRGDLHRRHRHINSDDTVQFRHSSNSHFCTRPPAAGSEPRQRGCNDEFSSQEVDNREAEHGLSGRYRRNNQLPGSVLLARERLVQRLRGVSVSGLRDTREPSQSHPSNHQRTIDADWETSVSSEEPASYTMLAESPAGAHQSVNREPQTKPQGLTKEALSELQHEVFVQQQNLVAHHMSKSSIECSICLESFVEGNELVNLHCGHRFHTSCLYPWLQNRGECPYCRSCIMLTS